MTTRVRVACSPDADDLFMMRALSEGLIDPGPFTWSFDTAPTDALNALAAGEGPEVCAISVAQYPAVADAYQLLPHGGSMGEGYGPVIVAAEPTTLDALEGRRVAVPGLTTSAWATLCMRVAVEPVVIPIAPYDLVFEALREGRVDAALLIHEGRLTFEREGFVCVDDLGAWWTRTTGLPLPLGANAIRRDLGDETIAAVSERLRASIAHGLAHRDAAIAWLLENDTALSSPEEVDRYLGMYANARTLDYGEDGRAGVEVFLEQGAALGLFDAVEVDWAP